VRLIIDTPGYPEALHQLPNPPRVLTTSGPLERGRAVAIVGAREACDEALTFAHGLAFQLARAGVVVISGGAVGIDGAAHRGALAAGGRTWVVSPTGQDRLFPPEHRALFDEIARSQHSRMLWPFADHAGHDKDRLKYRNGILTVLSEALVVVQARFKSGSRNAAAWARSLRRPVWAVAAAPWMDDFSGSLVEIEQETAKPLCSAEQLFRALDLDRPAVPPPVDLGTLVVGGPTTRTRNRKLERESVRVLEAPPKPLEMGSWSTEENSVFSKLLRKPIHRDQIVEETGLAAGSVSTALLTLSLKDVVVEGPEGFFRRRTVA
jgi:DNA processing protein